MSRIYLDYAATAPLLPEVAKAMAPWHSSGNASSLYSEGRKAKSAIDRARESVSRVFGCEFGEVVFTSGGTEAANLAIFGTAFASLEGKRRHIVLGASDHHCVLHSAHNLVRLGYRVDQAPVDRKGLTDLDWLADHVGQDTLLVSIMHANNETGVIQPVSNIASIAKRNGSLYHCDAVQTFAKQGWQSVGALGADLVSVSGHKIGAPKGIGALFIKAGTQLKPLVTGGGQEREMRGGTENVAAIVGFGVAVEQPTTLDPRLGERLQVGLGEIGAIPTVDGETPKLASHIHVRFSGLSAETMLIRFDRAGISASSGAACSSGSIEPSHVLLAYGYSPAEAKEGIRFTYGTETTQVEIETALARIAETVSQLRDR